LFVNGFDLI